MTGTDEVRTALAAEADVLARALGVGVDDRQRLATRLPLLAGPSPLPAPVPAPGTDPDARSDPDPGALGRMHESLLDSGHRHRRGVHYTPPAAAALLVALALDGRLVSRVRGLAAGL